MTITRIERLVRRVRAALQTREPGGAQVAGELAEVCREANRRIEQCQGSLRRGDLGGAMDLSEAEPPLAEQIRTLSFAEFEAWAQTCREQGWPVPETPDLRGFQGLQKSFQESRGKEIEPALVESYRAAMVAGDRPAALRVLATILRRRPGDSWAVAEKGKLLTKESEVSLRRMETLLETGDSRALVAELNKFDHLGLDAKHRPEIYEAARIRRLEARRSEAEEKVRQWLQEAEELRSAGAWRDVEQLLEKASAELEEAGARPPHGHLWNDLHHWTREQRAGTLKREELQKQEERVHRELDALEGLRRERTRRSSGRLKESLATVEEFLAMSGPDGALWPEPIHRRLRQEAELLEADLRTRRNRKLILGGVATVLLALAAAGVAQWKQEEIRQQIFLAKIDQMIAERRVEEAKAWLESEEAKRAAEKAQGAAELAKLRSFLDGEEQIRQSTEQEVTRLETMTKDRKRPLAERWEAWSGLDQPLSKVHPQWRPGLEQRKDRNLAELRTESREFRETRARGLREEMRRVEAELATWERSNQNRKEDAEKLQPLVEKLADGVDWKQESNPELAMPEELENGFTGLLARIVEARTRIEDFHQARLSLATAASPGEYRTALERYAANPCLGAGEKEKISQVLSAWKEPADLLLFLWLPWEAANSPGLGAGTARLYPSRLSASEEAILKDVVEDEYLHEIWAYQVPEKKNSTDRYRLYSRGKLAVIPGSGAESPYIYGQGEVFIPRECARDETVRFEKRPRSQAFMGIRQDMEKLLIGFSGQVQSWPEPNSEGLRGIGEALEKALSGDSVSPLARAPIHEALQSLLSSQRGISPLARAYLAGKVWKLATVSKDPSRFGLVFSPTLRKITAGWDSWGPVEPGAWLKEDVAGIDSDWVKAFSLEEVPPLVDEAKLVGQLWSKVGKAGLSFGGSLDGEGRGNFERLVNLEPGQILLGQGVKGEPVVGWRYDGKKWQELAKLRSYTPLLLLPRSPESFLQESCRDGRVPETWAKDWVRGKLPILFGGGGEAGSRH